MSLLALEGLHAGYGAIRAVRGISLDVEDGETVCLIGSNGAGKSTTLRAISGLVRAIAGSVRFRDRDVTNMAPHRIAEAGIAHVPEGRGIFARLTVTENLAMGAYLRRGPEVAGDLERTFEMFPRLRERAHQTAGTLSGGEQQMLAIGRALMARPRLLLLDEPSMGLSPILTQAIFERIREINREGTTILLVEQNATSALAISNRGYVIESGEIVLSGTGAALAANDRVRRAYLGEA
jgi:branched-chain amino acid transport system ATP-binding protein